MATEAVTPAAPQPAVEQSEKPTRLQKRFDKMTRIIYEQREEIWRLTADFSKVQQLLERYRLALLAARRTTNGRN